MLAKMNSGFTILASRPAAENSQIARLTGLFPSLPCEYVVLIREATEIELQHNNGQYIRICGPAGCIDMDKAYNISARMAGAIPIGDDGGGKVIFYMTGSHGFGLYRVGFGDLDANDAVFISPSLSAFLGECTGVEAF
jgi:hypothetical protein